MASAFYTRLSSIVSRFSFIVFRTTNNPPASGDAVGRGDQRTTSSENLKLKSENLKVESEKSLLVIGYKLLVGLFLKRNNQQPTTNNLQLLTNQQPITNNLQLLLSFLLLLITTTGWGQNYQSFNASGTNAWTSSAWSASSTTNACVSTGLTNAFTSGRIVYLCTANGTGSGAWGITIGGIIATESYTHSSHSGTLATGGNVITIDVASGKTLNLGAGAVSTAAGTGFVKAGSGTLSWSGANYTGGFTLNAGTMLLGAVTAMGGNTATPAGAVTINGGVIAAASARNITARYGSVTIGGNFTFGAPSNTSNITIADNISLGSSTRTIDLAGTAGTSTYTLGGVLSGTGSAGLTVGTNSGNGILVLTGANTYSGNTTVNGGTLSLSGSGSIASSPQIIVGSGGNFNVSGLTTALTLGSSQSLRSSATGSNTTATVTVASTKDLTLSAGGLVFTAYGGGATAPLTVTGASAGALALNSAPVTVTTSSALAVGTYKLIAKSGSANVSGTPGTLTVNGSGLAAGTSGALSVVSGELILTVSSGCTAPTTQGGTISLSSTTTTGSNYSFTRGDGTGGVIVVARVTATAAVDPTSGTTYTPSATGSFTGTTTTGTGNIVIYNGTAAGVSTATGNLSISNLSAGTQYTLTAYEFNTTGTCYNTTSPPSTNFRTLCVAPTTNTPSTVGSKSFTATWGSVTGASSYRLDVSAASDFSSFVSGYENLTVAGTSQSVTGLNYNTLYYFRVRAINGDGAASANSNTSSTTTKTQATSLVLVSVPSTGSVATNLSTFTVEARRADASVDDAYTSNVSISKVSGAGAITGNGAVAAVAGVATFASVQFSSADTYTISATDGTLTSAASSNIVVTLANASSILWSSSGGSAWLSTGNWTGSAVPTSAQLAQFQSNPTATTNSVGINMGGSTNNGAANQIVGAIEISSRSTALTIGNTASATNGTLTLSGVVVNGVSNTILRSNASGGLTIQASQSSTLGLALGNATENIISIESTGGITISSIISGVSRNLTKVGSGAGELILSGNNTYSGNTTISAGALALSGSGAIASSPQIIIGSGATFNVSGLTTALTLGASQSIRTSATGSNTTATLTVASTKDLTLSAGGLFFTAYGGGATAPLTVTGSSAGALALNSSPVTVTTTAALAVGTYKLIVKGGSATGVTGTPGTLTINGSGTASNTASALSVVNGELILTVSSLTGLTPPTLTAATGATVDNTFKITFTDDANWRTTISSITVGGSTLPTSAYNTATEGEITFDPSQSPLLQSAGSKTIVISSTTFNYNDATIAQSIAAGAAQNLSVSTQPVAPATNGGALATQPVVTIRDQYNNTLSGSSASVSAAVGSGTWTLGGTTSVNASSGVATFSGLTATSSNAVTGANITFTSGALSVTSNNFNIPAPQIGTYAFAGTPGTLAATGVASNVTFGNITLTGISQNGNSANAFSGSASWGSTFSSSSRYLEFTITANSGFLITPTDFVMDVFRSGAGATNYTVRSSVGNYASDLGTGTVTSSSATTISPISLSGASYSSLSSITFRIYGWGGNGSGDFRLDNIIVRGSVSAALTPPTITAAGSATVDGAFNVTFADNSAWRSAISSITVDGTTLDPSAYSVSAGQISFTPSASTLLQSSGSKSIAVLATGYSSATVTQTIGVGAASKLAIATQPLAPSSNGGSLATQPIIAIQDQYGNTTSSTATVTAAVGAGAWTVGGTTSRAGVSGTATFTNLTATSASAVTGATISFSSSGLTGVTSNTFNIPAPPPANDLCASPTSLTVGAAAVSGTTVKATYTILTNEPYETFSDVWYSFTAAQTGIYTVSVTNTASVDYDVYAFLSCPSSATGYVTGGSAATSSASSETMTFNGTSGTTYLVRVANTTSAAGSAFNISVAYLAPQPTAASAVTFVSRTNNSISISWTNGDGANRIVVARPSATGATAPSDGQGYTVNSASFSDGMNMSTASGNIVVYNGSGNAVTVTGLNAGASYSFDVYEYNGSGSTANYAAAASLTSQLTLSNEPTAHAASFTATVPSPTVVNLSFSAASSLPASGYLLLKKSSAFVSADYPVDGNAYSVGATIGGATVNTIITTNSTTSSAGTEVLADNTYFYLLVPFNWNGSNTATRNYYTGGTIPTVSATTPSASTDAVAVSSSEAATISSLTNDAAPLTSTTGTQVWQFTIRDGGSGLNDNDALPTKISSILLTEHASNTVASWFTSIRTVALFDGSTLLATGTVGNPLDNITFSGLSLTIPDNQSKTLTLRLSLNTSLGATDDGKRFVFSLTNSNITTVADGTSSGFPTTGSISSATSSANVIAVVATKLAFATQPSNVNISATMSPSVTVDAEDANGNRDLDYTTSVSLTSTGTLTGSPLIATPVSGLATFSNIVHTASETQTGRTLAASSGSLTSATSNTFNVVFAPVTIYLHDFGITVSTGKPYTTAPSSIDANLNSSSWTTSASGFDDFAGSSGAALSLGAVSGSSTTYTLSMNVAPGYQSSVTSYNFWTRRSGTGPTGWSMTINGISVGSGSLSGTSGVSIGQTNVTNAVSGQVGTITVVITLTGATGGTFRLDDFTLNGNVTCLTPSDKTVAAASASVCSGSSTNITVASSTVGVNYQLRNNADNSTIGSPVAGTGGTINLPTGNLTQATTFNVLATNSAGTCSPSPLQLTNTPTVSINALPTALSLTGGTICASPGGNGTITSSTSVVGVNYQLYNSSNTVIQSAKAGTGSGLSWSSLAAGNGYYVIATDASTGCTSTSNSVNVSTTANPVTPAAGNNSRCGTGTVALSVSGAGGTYTWYSDAGLTTQVGSGASYTTPSISSTTNYYVTETNGSGCVSNPATVTATVNANPSAPTAGNSSRCGIGNITITATPGSGQTIDWYAASSSGSVLSGGLATTSYAITNLLSTNSYYAEARNTSTGCVSATRTQVTATINSVQTITLTSGSASQAPTINTAITNIVYTVGGGATTASASPLPNGVSGLFSSGIFTISGTPLETGTFNYTVTTSPANGCTASLSGSIVVSPAAASTANYRTKQNGLFTEVSTWEFHNGSGWQNASAVPIYPTGTNNIEVNHALILNVNYTVGSSKTFEISSPSGSLTINPGYRFSVNNSTANSVNFGGRPVVLKSDANGTASIGTIAGSGAALTGATNVTVERYMQAKRKWRALTAPLTTGSTSNKIYDNWQNAGNVSAGTGAIIWSPGSDEFATGVANGGFSTSLLKLNTASNTWTAITNTQTEDLFDGTSNKGFMLFFTGPYNGDKLYISSGSAASTLSANGELRKGNLSFSSLAAGWHMIGNPYASAIRTNALTPTGLNAGGYVWNPGGAGTGVFLPITLSLANTIQSGQAFFVYSNGSGSLAFTESAKIAGSSNSVFRTEESNPIEGDLKIELNKHVAGNTELNDVAIVNYKSRAEAGLPKLAQFYENMSIYQDNTDYGMTTRKLSNGEDQIQLRLWQMKEANYQIKIDLSSMKLPVGSTAVLQDAFLNKETTLSTTEANKVDFNVTSNAASTGQRFRIVLRRANVPVTSVETSSYQIYPNPVQKGSSMQLEFRNQSAGKYEVVIYSMTGVRVQKAVVGHNGGTAIQQIALDQRLSAGSYLVEVIGEDGLKKQLKLVLQ